MREMQRWFGIFGGASIFVFSAIAATRIETSVINTVFAIAVTTLVIGVITGFIILVVVRARRAFEISPPHYTIRQPEPELPQTYAPPQTQMLAVERQWTFNDGSTGHKQIESPQGFDF